MQSQVLEIITKENWYKYYAEHGTLTVHSLPPADPYDKLHWNLPIFDAISALRWLSDALFSLYPRCQIM